MWRNAIAVLFFLAMPALAQQRDWSSVEIKATKVAGNIYMLTGAGGNIGVSVGEDGIVIIDDQFAPLAPKIREALRTISDKPIKFVVNTHYHGDHTGGNEAFGREAPIIAHENVRKRLQSGTTAMGRQTPPAPKSALPVVTFNDRLTIHVNGEDIRALHVQDGHTDGDSVIFFQQSNVVHMGDDFFNGGFPVIDINNGGTVRGMIAAIEKLLPTLPDDVKIIPGHGPLGDKKSLAAFAAMLRSTSAALEKEMKAGKSLEDIKKNNPLAAWVADWGKGGVPVERYTDTLFADLSRK